MMENKFDYYSLFIREIKCSLNGDNFVFYGIIPNSQNPENFIPLIEWWNNIGINNFADKNKAKEVFYIVLSMNECKVRVFDNLGEFMDIIKKMFDII
jgi:hypothetical protein